MGALAANPWFWSAVTSGLGTLGGALSTPDSENLAPFEGDLAPPELMARTLGSLGGASQTLQGIEPSLPSSYAQPLSGFSGGGLPFAIGAPAIDPALGNRSLLQRPNPWAATDLFSSAEGLSPGGGGARRPPDVPDVAVPRSPGSGSPAPGIRPSPAVGRRPLTAESGQSLLGTSGGGDGSEIDRAEAAAALFQEALAPAPRRARPAALRD